MAKQPLLALKGIKKSFGPIEVLKGVDLEIEPGEIVALVGDNGAGKSTLIKIITGVHAPSEGEIFFKGERITLKDVRPRASSASRPSTRSAPSPISRSCGATSSPAAS